LVGWKEVVGSFEKKGWRKKVGKKRLEKKGWEKKVGKKRLGKKGWEKKVGKKRLGKKGWEKKVGCREVGRRRLVVGRRRFFCREDEGWKMFVLKS
jgi:hypothetical protein